ncbi:putative oxidoreductase [Spirochaetia bacterium]|nr:putative oxidoreductase [Spirochaetia bacterium]
MPGGLVLGVASRDINRAREFASAWNIERSYGAYEELLRDPGIDAVYIAVTNNEHFRCCEAAIAAGKHILCEKPLVTSAADARTLAARAEAAGVFLMEAVWTRFLPTVLKAEEWVRAGRIGNPCGLRASLCANRSPDEYQRLYDPALGGGALLDLGVYGLHLARHFAMDRKLQNIKASVVPAATGVDLSTFVLLEYSGGFIAEVSCSIGFFACNDACITGDEGYIRIAPRFSSAPRIELFASPTATDYREEALDEFRLETPSGFEFEILHLTECIRRGKIQSDIVPLADTIEVSEIMEAVLKR